MWFEVKTGAPILWRTLRRSFSFRKRIQIFAEFTQASLTRDPFSNLLPAVEKRERACRQQLGPVLILDEVLSRHVEQKRRFEILSELVEQVGERFIESNLRQVKESNWEKLTKDEHLQILHKLLARFPNATGQTVVQSDGTIGFDVLKCRFVELCRAVHRPELAKLFCRADDRFFQKRTDIQFHRTKTLAYDDEPCNFRFSVNKSINTL